MPRIINPLGIDNCDRQRFQMMIKRLGQAERIPVLLQIAMGHLSQPVHAGIGSARCRDCMWAGFKFGQRSLNRPLNRGLICLSLPTGKRGTVIFDFERNSGHGARITHSCRKEKRGEAFTVSPLAISCIGP